jgi:precorrin-2 dehydrogenase / sirohydrochlorin ferrochelatase
MTKHQHGYPVLLDLAEKCCVIVGGGRVAERKVDGLLEAGARVIVISPMLTDKLTQRFDRGEIDVRCQVYESGLIAALRPLLVFAATNDPTVNSQVVNEARYIGVLVDAIDASTKRDFSTMATLRRGVITVGISTDGASPALTKHLRSRLDALIGSEYETLAAWLDEARPHVIDGVPKATDRGDLWRSVLASPILDLLHDGDQKAARAAFDALLDKALT